MAKQPTKTQSGRRTATTVWLVLGFLVLGAGVLAFTFGNRFRRVVQETNQVRNAVQEAERRHESVLRGTPVRKEFSSAFLQMAFGDNPQLLEQIRDALSQAMGERIGLAQGDAAMMLVTYRAEGEVRDVAIHIFGNMVPEHMPAFSSEGYWKNQLSDQFYTVGQSMLSLLGRQMVILANKDVQKSQQAVVDAVINNQNTVVQNYLHDPVSFIAVIPEPGKVLSDEFRPYMAAVLLKGKISKDEMRGEMVALSYDPKTARELAQLLSDIRLTAIGLARTRYGSSDRIEQGLEALMRLNIHAEGPTVVARTVLGSDPLDRGIPLFIQVLSKGMGRIKRGPGYPS
jgi:hypothetical protein